MTDFFKKISESSYIWIAFCLTALFFFLEGWRGMNLMDEGYLWYGSQRVLAGDVPIRDFFSYDPGRYYYVAIVMKVVGRDGLVALRFALALVQWVGIVAGLWVLSREDKGNGRILRQLLYALIIILWMIPRHKMVDMSISLVLIALLTWLQEKSVKQRFFIVGLATGIIAFFGRNHGMYAVFGLGFTMAWINYTSGSWKQIFQQVIFVGLGIFVGYLPMLGMIAFSPGFGEAFWDGLLELLLGGRTNLSKAIPWPRNPIQSLHSIHTMGYFLMGIFYIVLLVFPVGVFAIFLWFRKRSLVVSPVLVSCFFLSVPYDHFAFSRPGYGHLAQGIFPVLLGVLYLLGSLRPIFRRVGQGVLLAMVLTLSFPNRPFASYTNMNWKRVLVAGDSLMVEPGVAKQIKMLEDLASKYAPGNTAVVVLPFMPAAYPILGKQCPTWINFFTLHPLSTMNQKKEINRIKAALPGLIWIDTRSLDGISERSFSNYYPLLNDYIQQTYDEVSDKRPNNVRLFTQMR